MAKKAHDVDWLLATAYVYMQTQKFNLSTIFLESVLIIHPKSSEGHRLIAYSYFKQERYKESFHASQKWQQLPKTKREALPKYVAHMFLLQSKALLKLKRADLARKCYNQFLNIKKEGNI